MGIKKADMPNGVEVFYRNIAPGFMAGTLIHITVIGTNKQYCGFDDPFGEHIFLDDTDNLIESQICKKCYNSWVKNGRPV